MRVATVFRALTPWGWVLMLLAVVVLAGVVGRGLGLRWDPFDLAGRRLEATERRVETLDQDLAARRLEVEGAAGQARRLETHHRTLNAVADTTARTLERTEQANDADIPLEDDRAARLRDHDRELCRLAPAVCNAAETDPAGCGGAALLTGRSAGQSDAGGPGCGLCDARGAAGGVRGFAKARRRDLDGRAGDAGQVEMTGQRQYVQGDPAETADARHILPRFRRGKQEVP